MAVHNIYDRQFIGKYLYYCSFIVAIFLSFIATTSFVPTVSSSLMNRLSYLVEGCLLIKIFLLDRISWKELLWKSVILLVAVISWRQTLYVGLLLFISFILAAKDVNFRNLVKIYFSVGCILLIYMIVMSQIGVVSDMVYHRHGFARHALGLNYPTDLAAHVFYLVLAYAYINFKKLNLISYMGFVITGVVVYSLTQARTDALLIILSVPVIYIAQKAYDGQRISRLVASFYWAMPVLAAYIAVVASYFYDPSNRLLRLLNKIVSTRLSLSKKAINRDGFSLFGQRVVEHGWGGPMGHHFPQSFHYFYIDSSYMRLVIIYGVLIGLIILAVMSLIAFTSTKQRGYCLAAIMLLVAIHSIIEQHLFEISFNPFLLALLSDNAYLKNSLGENNGTEKQQKS